LVSDCHFYSHANFSIDFYYFCHSLLKSYPVPHSQCPHMTNTPAVAATVSNLTLPPLSLIPSKTQAYTDFCLHTGDLLF